MSDLLLDTHTMFHFGSERIGCAGLGRSTVLERHFVRQVTFTRRYARLFDEEVTRCYGRSLM